MIPDELQVPGYDIEERIGKGGMASVYRARQHTFDRHVALKVLRQDLSEDESFCQRFVQESLIVAKLHHSNIVQVYDVGEFQNNFYIAMEYLNGGDLNSRLETGVAIKDTIQIIRQAASALDFAHNKGIIHRDIKPDNIMFREDGAAVLTDFGIAKEIHSDLNLTQTGLIVGTPKYMAPEQIRGSDPSPQADIYALGVLLFQCLTDCVPFEGKDMVSTAYKHFNDPIPELPPLVAAFQPIVDTMLAKNPEERYSRAMEVIDALDELSGESKNSSKTNLEITKEYYAPGSNLDPTMVHPQNQDTDVQQSLMETVAQPSVVEPEVQARSEEKTKVSQTRAPQIMIAATLFACTVLGFAAYNTFFSKAENKPSQPSPIVQNDEQQVELPEVNTQENSTLTSDQKLTIERLLTEAQLDIREHRLKKPDANNAFNKIQRVLQLSPNNPQAIATQEQIAEEYAKLADLAVGKRQYRAAHMFLDDARSASPKLELINTIATKLNNAESSETRAQKAIQSMEKSLMIDGLLKSAAIDEDEGRLRSPLDDNAFDKYLRVLEIDPKNVIAQSKVEQLKP